MKHALLLILVLLLTGCGGPAAVPGIATMSPPATLTVASDIPTLTTPIVTPRQTKTVLPQTAISPQPEMTATPIPVRPDAADWQTWPVVPEVSDTAREIYQRGLALGRTGERFIKIGDCETYSTWFLADFETENYTLGAENQGLVDVIEQFQGSYSRLSVAAKAGFNAASVLSPFWADREACEPNETPLACEVRIMQPSFALVTLGSNDVWQPEKFEANYRSILDELIAAGVVPILATKADNVEGDHVINHTIARLAVAYDLPVWNFWLAVKDLPDGGLQEDGVHLTWAPNRFDDPRMLENAWPVRNLTALQVLDAVWRGVRE